jgi:hypothetical protein
METGVARKVGNFLGRFDLGMVNNIQRLYVGFNYEKKGTIVLCELPVNRLG